jgi:hypothetical protein
VSNTLGVLLALSRDVEAEKKGRLDVVPPEFHGVVVGWGAAASSIKARSLAVLNSHVKENCVFLVRGEPLIF